jgi:hypothetical protein
MPAYYNCMEVALAVAAIATEYLAAALASVRRQSGSASIVHYEGTYARSLSLDIKVLPHCHVMIKCIYERHVVFSYHGSLPCKSRSFNCLKQLCSTVPSRDT